MVFFAVFFAAPSFDLMCPHSCQLNWQQESHIIFSLGIRYTMKFSIAYNKRAFGGSRVVSLCNLVITDVVNFLGILSFFQVFHSGIPNI